jgi:hypothetical protein
MNKNNQQIFSSEFRWVVGLLSLLISFIMLLWASDQGILWFYFIPLFFFVVFGACLLPEMIAIWFRRILLVWMIAMLLWGLYFGTTKDDIVSMIIGGVLGGFSGLLGGVIGGGVSGYFDPLTKIIDLDVAARFKLARSGAEGCMSLGVIAGLIVGAIVGAFGGLFPPLFFFLIVGVVFIYIAEWFEVAAGESMVGLPGGIILGAILGVAGGYAGRMLWAVVSG